MAAIDILIVEDHPEFLRAFVEAVGKEADFRLVGAVTTVGAAHALLERAVPDVLVVDLGLPDGRGTDLIRSATARRRDADALVVTIFGDDKNVIEAIEAGATGYVLKDTSARELAACIRELRAGGSPISPLIARKLLRTFRTPKPAPAAHAESASAAADAGLTPREAEVLGLVAKGFAFAEVARLLEMSPHTVTAHVKKVYQKLAVHSRGEAVYEATRMGLL